MAKSPKPISIAVYTNRRATMQRDEMISTLKSCYKALTKEFPEMSGFAIVAWGEDGSQRSGYYIPTDSNINKLQVPETVAGILRNDILNEMEIEFEPEV